MIINHSYKFIFIHVPKAAGTSVTHELSEMTRYCDQEIGGTGDGQSVTRYYAKRFGLRKHSPSTDVRKIVGEDVWEQYFTFGFVRNPYTRLVSSFKFLKGWANCPDHVRQRLDEFDTVQDFLDSDYWSDHAGPDNMFRPQTFWLCDPVSPEHVHVNFVGKTENIAESMKKIYAYLGSNVQETKIGFRNKSTINIQENVDIVWHPRLIERMQERYAPDFKAFGYAPDIHTQDHAGKML